MRWRGWARAGVLLTTRPVDPARPSAISATERARAADPFLDLHRRVLAAFELLSDASDDERRLWLQEQASTDSALATEVAALLLADRAGPLHLPTTPGPPANDEPAAYPLSVGPYRLVRRLGGGMGDVFLAERDDGLFAHTVAIKLIRGGRATQRLSEHLFAERKILAGLQHPNIAQLFGGGTTPEGLPFIVMEYLDGQFVTDYADRLNLGLSERLRLFLTVCEAVQFAHQNLIVHADIKPSNIVVTETGRVKLLDFGIARWVDRAPVETEAGEVGPMTRAYAAPERLAGADPSVSADVYSLGVLLHEMLRGGLPDAVSAAGDDAAPKNDRPAPAIRPRDLRGALDAIIAKALAPDPRARYASVAALSEDIQRYGRGLPVTALPDTWQYRTRCFVLRHRLGLSLTAAALLLASVAAIGASLLYLQSERDRALADRRFAETHGLADYIINDVDAQLAKLPGALPVRRQLVSRSHGYLQALEKDRQASPALKLDIAAGYLSLARIYGLDPSGGVGNLPAARQSLKQANAIIAAVAVIDPDNPRLLLLKARSRLVAGAEIFVAPDLSILKTSLADLQAAQTLFGEYLQRKPSDVEAQLSLWRAQIESGRIYVYLNQPERTLGVTTANLYKADLPVQTHEQAVERDYLLNGSYLMLADANALTNPREGRRYYRLLVENVEAMRRRGESDLDNDFIESSGYAGKALMSEKLGDLDRATGDYEVATSIMQRLLSFGPNHEIRRNLIVHQGHLAAVYSRLGRDRDAQRLGRVVIAEAEADVAGGPATAPRRRALARALQTGAAIEHSAGNRVAACELERRALQQWTLLEHLGAMLPTDVLDGGPLKALHAAAIGDCPEP